MDKLTLNKITKSYYKYKAVINTWEKIGFLDDIEGLDKLELALSFQKASNLLSDDNFIKENKIKDDLKVYTFAVLCKLVKVLNKNIIFENDVKSVIIDLNSFFTAKNELMQEMLLNGVDAEAELLKMFIDLKIEEYNKNNYDK